MKNLLPTFIFLLLSALLFACQSENPIVDDPNEKHEEQEEEIDPMIGKWNIERHSVVIRGGVIQSQDAGYFDLQAEGEGEAVMTHQGSKYEEKHAIEWVYDEDNAEMSIDHLDGSDKQVYTVKDKTDNSQKWQQSEYNSNGELEKMTEILLRK